MKKPLLLLVDDDRAVLEALEAELRPAFEEIARIEAFDDPRAVIDALPRWAGEQRSIAVAIVDQKMPRMTGVELLVRLKALAGEARKTAGAPAGSVSGASAPTAGAPAATLAFHPANHVRSVVLTGYADLDSAVAAINQARVERYVEKPWTGEALRRAVRRMLQLHLGETGADAHVIFREIATTAEAHRHLALRYEGYARMDTLSHVLPKGTTRLDADEFDPCSWHYGLFGVTLAGEEMMGTHRHTPISPHTMSVAMARVLSSRPDLVARAGARRTHGLPLLKYWPDREAIEKLLDRLTGSGREVMEPSRAVIHPPAGEASVGSLFPILHFVESTVSFGFAHGCHDCIMTCTPEHARVYRKALGFREAEGTVTSMVPELGNLTVSCLHGTLAGIPAPVRRRMDSLLARIRRAGAACRCKTFPACLPGPYESGDFAAADLFCPAQARDLIPVEPPRQRAQEHDGTELEAGT